MIKLSKKFVVFVLYLLFTLATSDVLDAERSSFFGFMHEVPVSSSSYDLVLQLNEAVMTQAAGDRRVRRYFQQYDTSFTGEGRRKG